MASRTTVLAVGVMAAIAAAAACSSFEDAGAEPAGDAGLEGAPADGGVAIQEDALAADAADEAAAVLSGAEVLAAGYKNLVAVAATETDVYFVAQTEGVIYTVPLAGGPVAEFHRLTQPASPSSLAISGNVVVWGDRAKEALAHRTIGTTQLVTQPVDGGTQPVALASATTAGGTPRLVVLTRVKGATATGGVRYYDLDLNLVTETSAAFTNPSDVAVLGQQVWWAESNAGGNIWEGQLDEGSVATVRASQEDGCESIAVDNRGVYWTRPTDGLVRMMTAQYAVSTLAMGEKKPSFVAADASGVYWLTRDSAGTLRRSTREELPPQTLSKGFEAMFADNRVRPIALTASYVVWLTDDGRVLRRAK